MSALRSKRFHSSFEPFGKPKFFINQLLFLTFALVLVFVLALYIQKKPTVENDAYAAGGTSLRFYGNGVNQIDRVEIKLDNPQVPADMGSGDFTMEWWMKAVGSANSQASCNTSNDSWINGSILIDRDIWGSGDYGDFGVSLMAGKIAFGVNNGSSGYTLCGKKVVADGSWHHVALQRRSSDGYLYMYIDGVLDSSADGPNGNISYRDNRPTNYANDPYLVLGAEKHDAGSEYPSYDGYMDELRLSNSIRYSSTFTPVTGPFTTDSQTLALYHFDSLVTGNCNSVFEDELGISSGICNFGGNPAGPVWTSDMPFGSASTPTPTIAATNTPTPTATQLPTTTNSPTQTPTPVPSGNITSLVLFGLNEGSGTTVTNSVNGSMGTITSATWSTDPGFGNALTFNNGSRLLYPTITLGTRFTVMARVYNPSFSGYETITTVGSNRDFFLRSGRLAFYNGSTEYLFGNKLATRRWYNVAFSYDGTTMRAYIDGNLAGSRTLSLGSVSGNLIVGAWTNGSTYDDYFTGSIDEVRIYNSDMTQSQIQSLMNTPL